MIFIDTSAWFALLYERAAQRPDAVSTFVEIEKGRYRAPVTTDYGLDETLSLLRQRAGLAPVDRLSGLLRESPSIRPVRVSDAVFEESLRLMLSRPDKSWCFTDCTSFVTMRETRIPRAFTWDQNFTEAGFEIVPAP